MIMSQSLRPALRTIACRPTPTSRILPLRQIRPESNKHDLGGPGGQQPPSSKPGGPEAIQRNWVPIAGIVLAVGLGFTYFTYPKKSQQVLGKAKKQIPEDATDAFKELRGEGKKSQGGFRSE